MQFIKCVVVGDGAVGKTSMLISYVYGASPTEYIPTVFDNFSSEVKIDERTVSLGLFDTAGQEDYERMRPLSYAETNIFLLCFSVVSPTSFDNIDMKWVPEVKQHCPNAILILVGTQVDLRTNQETINKLKLKNQKPISNHKGKKLSKRIGAINYMECSAITLEGIKEIFQEVVESVVHQKGVDDDQKKNCSIM